MRHVGTTTRLRQKQNICKEPETFTNIGRYLQITLFLVIVSVDTPSVAIATRHSFPQFYIPQRPALRALRGDLNLSRNNKR